MISFALSTVLLAAELSVLSLDPQPNDWGTSSVERGEHGYIEYHRGNTNLILSVPHNGMMKPSHMKTRDKCDVKEVGLARVNMFGDANTMDIGKAFILEYMKLTGKQPHIIATNLHRSILDVNRALSVAACPNVAESELAYNEYHNFIKRASKEVGGPALLLDLHGQNHKQNSTELGYLLLKSELNEKRYSARKTSIASLVKRSGLSVQQLLYGTNSLGANLEKNGYMALPSPRQKMPGKDKYYRGGYITQTHGSDKSGQVDAIQIEVPGEVRFDNKAGRAKYARALARSVKTFHEKFY